MARVLVRIPHVVWRDGRPRFEPGPALRAMGYKGRDLTHADGGWLSLDEASRFSRDLQAELAARRERKAATGRMPPRPRASVAAGPMLTTVEALFDRWFAAGCAKVAGKRLAPASIASYRKFERVIRAERPSLWAGPAGALDKVICFNLYETVVERRGVASGAGAVRTLSAALSWGMRRGLVPLAVNPCEKLGMVTPAPRLRVAEREAIALLVEAADRLGRPEIGDAVMLGVWTGQRQADRLHLKDEGQLGGHRIFRQIKTGAVVAIPESPLLAARLAAARERRKRLEEERRLAHLEVCINERDNRPWKPDHYRHVFAAIVASAAHGVAVVEGEQALLVEGAAGARAVKYLPGVRAARRGEAARLQQAAPAWLIAPHQPLEGLRDQDLRDTAVTWLALAGCTLPEIAAVTGHTLDSITSIMKHYLARHPELADHAIAKLVQWHG